MAARLYIVLVSYYTLGANILVTTALSVLLIFFQSAAVNTNLEDLLDIGLSSVEASFNINLSKTTSSLKG